MSANRRAFTGTAPALVPGVKIGQPLSPGREFIATRNALFDELKAEYLAALASKPRTPISVRLPSGAVHAGMSWETTPQQVAEALKIKGVCLARVKLDSPETVAMEAVSEDEGSEAGEEDGAEEDGELWDLTRPLPCSCELRLLKFEEAKHAFWHSSAHLLGLAIESVLGGQVTIGPALQRGFYYDFYLGEGAGVTDNDHRALETAARKAASSGAAFERLEVSKDEALALFASNPFKLALIQAKVNGPTSVYRCGDFVDLCRGPHLPHLGWIKAFAVEKQSSAYWLGDAKGDNLQRVYGIAFPDLKLLKEHERLIAEARQRDHRVLGNKLGYFFFEPNYAPGCAFWTPLGAKLYNKLVALIRAEYRNRGFEEVITPNLCSADLFKVSGHWQNYQDSMFTLKVEDKDWALKPMNCPTHCCIFKHLSLSYKQLPIRMADFSVLHRNEFSGSLAGLTRVRRFQQDDAHIFCDITQVQAEVAQAIDFLRSVYRLFHFDFKVVLSTRPKKALGSIELWQQAEQQLSQALDLSGLPWSINKGDGAFYGPKIDIKVFDALKRQHQCGTIQLDFQMPIRFDLQYKTNENFEKDEDEAPPPPRRVHDESLETELRPGFARPVMIHRAVLGSVERMSAILLEHFAGKLPFFISPRQALICPVSEKVTHYASFIRDALVAQGFDVAVDLSNNTINKKIREASVYQWNYILVVGEKEAAEHTVTVRCRETPHDQSCLDLPALVELFRDLNDVAHRQRVALPTYVPPAADAA